MDGEIITGQTLDQLIGHNIRRFRLAHELETEDMGMLLYIPEAQYIRFEEGSERITIVMLGRIAQLFRVSAVDLIPAALPMICSESTNNLSQDEAALVMAYRMLEPDNKDFFKEWIHYIVRSSMLRIVGDDK